MIYGCYIKNKFTVVSKLANIVAQGISVLVTELNYLFGLFKGDHHWRQ